MMTRVLEAALENEAALEAWLSRPTPASTRAAADGPGDYLILGAGGKMGPTLAMLIRRSLDEAGRAAEVIAASRFTDAAAREKLESHGIRTFPCDLFDPAALAALSDAANVLFLAGRKFGSTGDEATTWAFNTLLPANVCRRYPASRIVALSSGNVYPFAPVGSGGCDEGTPPAPVGEYAQSVLGRERIFEYFSRTAGTRACLIRLNYAVEPRYGVLVDLARRIDAGETVDLSTGYVNMIDQRDANEHVLRALDLCESPARVLNVTGPETLSVRALAEGLAARLGRPVQFAGREAETALLSNAGEAWRRFGPPRTDVETMMDAVAIWMRRGGPLLHKPTHFDVRDGKF